MTITFFSNFLNDHQLPLCLSLQRLIGDNNFRFVAHEEIAPERIRMGFKDMNSIYPFVVKAYENQALFEEAQRLMLSSDVVIIGSSHNMPTDQRLKEGKLTFRYNERVLKKGDLYWFDPRVQHSAYLQWGKHRNHNLYELCASAYTARDISLFGFPKSKCFKWGYFPIVKRYEDIDDLIRKKDVSKQQVDVTMLWAGRLIDWKHPEMSVKLAKRLKAEGVKFRLDIIGIGSEAPQIKSLIQKYNLADCVNMLGAMPPEEVRKHMEDTEIFLFTSDKNEGWGAVLNEAMNSACAVVANNEIGSVPFLLKHGYNGMVFNKGNFNSFYQMVKILATDNAEKKRLGKNAYLTLTDTWNSEHAATSLIELIHSINNGTRCFIEEGPCSPVKI